MKHKIFLLIDEAGRKKSRWNQAFHLFIITLILLSITAIILESYQPLRAGYEPLFYLFEVFTVVIFSVEYFLRIWTADLKYPDLGKWQARRQFIFSPLGLVDLIAVLPFYLPFFFKFDLRFIRILRIVRLLRIFKLNRYTQALKLFSNVFFEKRNELGITLFVMFILLLMSSTIMYYLESDVQPEKFPDIISTFWWAVATLTTVGYGDVYTMTGWGKLISGIIAILGIGLVALPTGILSAGFIEKIEEKNQKKIEKEKKVYQFCPHCGEKL
ncbi:MAG: potassium channel protein [Bacteroidetes bacterium]|nr:MAG: potassium channel protein [Bacteroidota bacterium]PTM12723.1 MAG: potassium channel protein [Bacteroidota bacterium]